MQGATAGDDIYLDKGLTQRQRRCALMHELIHWEHDHEGHQTPGVEEHVDRLASVALIDLPSLRDALLWGRNLWEAAEYLSVTERFLVVRLQNLTDGERCILDHIT